MASLVGAKLAHRIHLVALASEGHLFLRRKTGLAAKTLSTSTFTATEKVEPFVPSFLQQRPIQLTLHDDIHVATLSLDRPPTNALTLEMLQTISKSIQLLEEQHPEIEGLVLASQNPRIFCSGLDLKEFHKPDPKRLAACWREFQQVFIDLYGSRMATVAAIDGHAPAAGCLLALACDYRVMASSAMNAADAGTIGLNETVFGVVPPRWMFDIYSKVIGSRDAEQAMTLGGLYSPEDALHYGLVDRLVEHGHVQDESLKEMRRWLVVDSQTRARCRQITRKPFIENLEKTRREDVEQFCDNITSDSVQSKISAYLARLKSRKTKPNGKGWTSC